MQDITILLERYKRVHDKAVLAHERGDEDSAKKNFLYAAEIMFEIANKSPGKLKEIRLEKAKVLVELAEKNMSKLKISPNEELKKEDITNKSENDFSFKPKESTVKLFFKDLIGLSEAKEIVKTQMILPLVHPEAYKIYNKKTGGGMILFGPPGTGKTSFAKAIANEAKATFFYVKASDILDKYVGESEKKIASLFNAMGKEKRSVLFVDDMDSLFMKRGIDHHNDERVNEFLQQMDGFNSLRGNNMLIGGTNRPWALDSAITRPGRFSRLVFIGLPNFNDRIKMIKKFLEGSPIDKNLNYERIASQTEFYSGADLRELCEQSKVFPLMKFINNNDSDEEKKVYLISNQDFDKAIKKIPSSINIEELKQFETYKDKKNIKTR